MDTEEFIKFDKIARLNRNCVITEKIDGTNAQIFIKELEGYKETDTNCLYQKDGLAIFAGSKNRWITPTSDNAGFAKWVIKHVEELLQLESGRHFGEWWGSGIQRRYGLDHKRFSLFNAGRWTDINTPDCCHVVPILYSGPFTTYKITETIQGLEKFGSQAVPGFMNPEGIVIYHEAARMLFKKTIKNDEKPKSSQEGK